ncbi:hypothetical protein CISIN_1g044719mg [Citrus sinensis]|uniref:Uncharacterized protein n=1 Tax=Citrus sinensis TaxID=2711 RepID=A0A067D103_CITSI|nr:hypothetical protein CISIN_1g044719mg [Citrus sinensis]
MPYSKEELRVKNHLLLLILILLLLLWKRVLKKPFNSVAGEVEAPSISVLSFPNHHQMCIHKKSDPFFLYITINLFFRYVNHYQSLSFFLFFF